MASVVDICNKALSLLGQKSITSLDDESPEALACRIHWEQLRDEVLRSHPWNCAIKRAALNRLVDAPAFGFKYYYQLPADCLFVVSLESGDYFKIEGRKLLTDSSAANIIYVFTQDDSTTYDAQLSAGFSYLLAAELAPGITASQSESDRLRKIGDDKISFAKSSDAIEAREPNTKFRKWLSAKYGV